MSDAADPVGALGERIQRALVAAFGPDLAGVDPVLRRSQHADYQSNVALSLKGRVAESPRDVAARIVATGELADVVEKVEVAGPGFLNLTLKADFLAGLLASAAASPRLGVAEAAAPETCVVDYSSPNIAKEMHVGHLRSTVIGDALVRVLQFAGHRVVRQNHLGDWGTQFGMLIEHLLDRGAEAIPAELADLEAFYREARRKFDGDAAFADRSRARVVLLQKGDAQALGLWERLVAASRAHVAAVYEHLDVTLRDDDIVGESFYNAALDGIIAELEQKGLARVDQGALCVFPPGFTGKGGAPMPLIIRKQDGGYGYATTDLAAIKHRAAALGGTRLLYVVGAPQQQHLAMVFKTAELAGWLAPPARAEHVAFGSVLGADGKMFKTRAGDTVKLLDLLSEADDRALAVVEERNADLPDAEKRSVARAVAIGAIKYADLSSDRVKDYVFDWDRMLATEGNTGPYLQYAHARSRSILRKAGEPPPPPEAAAVAEPEERALAVALLSFGAAVRDVERSLEPHRLCTYLYDLAQTFSTFFVKCPVLKAPTDAERRSRLVLCDLTARTIAQGLDLLGIRAPERM